MFTGPVGPVEVFFYWPKAVFGKFNWPGDIGSPLASSPVRDDDLRKNSLDTLKYISTKLTKDEIKLQNI